MNSCIHIFVYACRIICYYFIYFNLWGTLCYYWIEWYLKIAKKETKFHVHEGKYMLNHANGRLLPKQQPVISAWSGWVLVIRNFYLFFVKIETPIFFHFEMKLKKVYSTETQTPQNKFYISTEPPPHLLWPKVKPICFGWSDISCLYSLYGYINW